MNRDDRVVDVVKLSKPAQRALENADIVSFVDLAGWTEADLAGLHGLGPTAFPPLLAALAEREMTFKSP